jgi:GPH family glycoside/pentoside/hexuronide:cation symporter
VAWASGAFPQAIAFNAFSVLFFRYLTDTVGLEAALVGTIIGASKFYDALIAPAIGHVTDRLDTPLGRRRLWMLLGGLGMAVSLVTCFNVAVGASYTVRVAWAVAGYVVFATGYMVFAIPWLAMPPEVTDSVHARTRMMAWRVAFSSIGQGLAISVGPMLLAASGAGVVGYGRLGWALGILCLAGTVISVFATRGVGHRFQRSSPSPATRIQWRDLVANRPFVTLLLLKASLYFGLGFNGAALALLTRWVINVSDYWLGIFTLTLVVISLLSQPGWVWLSGRFGKRSALIVAFAGLAAFHLTLAFNTGSASLLLVQGAMLGAFGGGVYMLTQSLLPDVIEHDTLTTGQQRGGLFAGAVSLLETASSAIAIFVMGLLLSAFGYVEGIAHEAMQPASARLAIILCGAVFPACFELVSLLILCRLPPERGRSQS